MSSTKRAILPWVVLVASLAGCDEPQTFAVVEKNSVVLADFERQDLHGQDTMLLDAEGKGYSAEVTSEMVHPEFIAKWTNLEREVEVDLYVLRYEDYVAQANVPPPELDNVFWTSVPPSGPQFGETRPTQIHLHPGPGKWVLLFYNPLLRSPANRARLSAEVFLNYF